MEKLFSGLQKVTQQKIVGNIHGVEVVKIAQNPSYLQFFTGDFILPSFFGGYCNKSKKNKQYLLM